MRLSGTKTGAVNQYRGLGNQLWDLAGNRPSLDLPFSDTKSLVDTTTGKTLVDHTRASSGTYVDGDGLIKTATTNLLLRSEEFETAGIWLAGGSSFVTPNAIEAPNGTLTADMYTTAGAGESIYQNIAVAPSTEYVFSLYVRLGTMSAVNYKIAVYNNTSPSFIAIDVAPTQVPTSTGWTRIDYKFTTPSGCTSARVYPFRNSAVILSSTVYFWGAQLEQSSTVGEYVKTTSTINSAPRFDHDPTTGESLGLLVEESRTNLLLRSEEFDNASWLKAGILAFGSGSTANATTAPNGTVSADLLTESTAVNSERNCYQFGFTATPATLSCYVKPNGRNFVGLRFYAASGNWVRVTFTLTGSGTTSAISAGSSSDYSATSASIALISGGWYRVSLTATRTSGVSFAVIDFATSASPTLSASSGNEFYAGDGTSGIYLWGAQLEEGSFPTSYIPTTTSAVTRAADVASISGSNFSSWYNTTQGTVFTSQKTAAINSQQGAYWFSASPTLGRGIAATIDTRNVAQRLNVYNRDDVSISSLSVSPLVDGEQQKIAHSWAGGTQSASLNGLLNTGSYNAIYPGINQLSIGFTEISAGSPQYLSGSIKRFTYWPTRLPNDTLQSITL